jgi:hypothetical protein
MHCSASGFGVIGTTIALASYQQCLNSLEARGYRVPGTRPVPPSSTQDVSSVERLSTLRSKDGKLAWKLPPGWVVAPASAASGPLQLYAREPVLDGAAVVTTTNRGDVPDFQAYVEGLQETLLRGLSDATTTPVEALTVGGRQARRFEAVGTVKGLRIHYQFTAVLGTDVILKLNAWLPASRFAAEHARIGALAEGLTEATTERGV